MAKERSVGFGYGRAPWQPEPPVDPVIVGLGPAASGEARARLVRPPSNIVHPNEPAGFVPWWVHDWQTFPNTTEVTAVPASDKGTIILGGVSASVHRGTVIDDPTAPHGYGRSVRVIWPADFPVGNGLWNWAARSHTGDPSSYLQGWDWDLAIKLQKWYISIWILWEPMNEAGEWEMHFDKLRIGTCNRHITGGGTRMIMGWTTRGLNSANWDLWGTEGRDSYNWGYQTISPGDTKSFHFAQPGPTVGVWTHHEMVCDRTIADPMFRDAPAGEEVIGPTHVKRWQNGTLILDKQDYHTMMRHPMAEFFINLNQSSGVRSTQDKYLRYSGLYISGELFGNQAYPKNGG